MIESWFGGENNEEHPEKIVGGPAESYEDVDVARQIASTEARLKEISEMYELDEDTKEERRKLEQLLDNLKSNDQSKTY